MITITKTDELPSEQEDVAVRMKTIRSRAELLREASEQEENLPFQMEDCQISLIHAVVSINISIE